MKYIRFEDIPQFTRHGSWECDYHLDRLIVNIDEWVEEQGLNLNPDFQRGHVWKPRQQRAFIEFFLRGGKTARTFYFNNPGWHGMKEVSGYSDFVIVDGLQRLTAIRRFLSNEIKVFGTYYREFTDSLRLHQTFRVNVNDLKSKEEVLQWYLDFNSGGTVHTKAELEKVRKMLVELRSGKEAAS